MDVKDVKDKIRKLLALGTSPYEGEAKAAILKARSLMAKYKLTEFDVQDVKNQKLYSTDVEKVKWTTDSGNIWMVGVARTICGNYRCAASWVTPSGTRTHTLRITGIGEDAELCKIVMEYAVGFMLGAIKVLQRRNPRQDPKTIARSYADGFILGLQMAFEDQDEEHPEWGLVVTKPEKVRKFENSLSSKNVKTKSVGMDPLAYIKGQNDGRNFNPKRVIGDGGEKENTKDD